MSKILVAGEIAAALVLFGLTLANTFDSVTVNTVLTLIGAALVAAAVSHLRAAR
ncbi:hypothetical protein ACFCWY_29750 [Streptomyces sp. NPDC056362]|uniref:hypothetical protein n=1 Tax=unclassified Streptomyces TaxID=2593676 RepID=UPI0035DDC493